MQVGSIILHVTTRRFNVWGLETSNISSLLSSTKLSLMMV